MAARESFAKKLQSSGLTIAAVAFAFFTLMGVNSSLNALEDRVRVLDDNVKQLNRVENHIRTLQEDVNDIAKLRNDILEAIETATRRSARADRADAERDRRR